MADTKSKDWFESWFDSEYYHLLYAHRDEKEASDFLDTLLAHMQLEEDTVVLDLACGKGRHALHLASRGMQVTGLDLSENSISALRHLNTDRVYFERWDMRKTYRPAHFDVILNLFTSFGYFSDTNDNLRTLQAIHDGLRPGGHFLIDYLNVIPVKDTLPVEAELSRDGVMFRTWKHLESGCIKKDIQIHDKGKVIQFQESVQALELTDFEAMFNQIGLEQTGTFGDYAMRPFLAKESPRLIMTGRRPPD